MASSLPPRRTLAIWLPTLAIDRWRRRSPADADTAPTALVDDGTHGPRIVAVNAIAAALGVTPGARLADVRAFAPAIVAVPHDTTGDRALLEHLALWAQRWGPTSAIDPPDGIVVDVTGAAHLFAGEDAVIADVVAQCAARALTARAAIAPTAAAAWALAHFAPAVLPAHADPRDALAPLPIAALRLDADVQLVLRRLGLKRIGDVMGVGRDALMRRFRTIKSPAANPLVRLDQLFGRTPEPLLPVERRVVPRVQRRLLEPIVDRALLDQVLGDLAAAIAVTLEHRRLGARRVLLRAFRVDDDVVERMIELAAPTRDPAHIVRLFGPRLDDLDAGFGIDCCDLIAPWCEPLATQQGALADGTMVPAGTTLAELTDRIAARLGPAALTRPHPFPSHRPERAVAWLPGTIPPRPLAPATSRRPTMLLDHAEPIDVLYATPAGLPRRFRWRGGVRDIVCAEGPERIAPEWWREPGRARLRDYYRIEDDGGRRYWIYRHGLVDDGRGAPPRWYLHGLF